MKHTRFGYVANRGTDYNGEFPEAMEKVREMQEQMDIYCQYLSPKDQVCNRCLKVHVSPFKRPIL